MNWLIVTVTVLAFMLWSPLNADTAEKSRRLFDVVLSPAAARLLDDVEKLFGRAVREELSGIGRVHGNARVEDDGTPVIMLSDSDRFTSEETIVHELFHLKLIGEGSPSISFFVPPNTQKPEQDKLLGLLGYLRSTIQHVIFYPEIRQMGLQPDRYLNAEINDVIAGKGDLNLITAESPTFILSVTYARVLLESDDVDLKKRFAAWADPRMSKLGLAEALELVQIIKEGNAQSGADEVRVFLECLNRLYRGSATLTAPEVWQTLKKGDFPHRSVTVSVHFDEKFLHQRR